MKKFNLVKHGDRKSSKWITASNLRAARLAAEKSAGLQNQRWTSSGPTFDWAWETADRGYVYILHVIQNHQIVRSYTLRPDWR